MRTKNLKEMLKQRRAKNIKRTPGEREKLYIWNSNQIMTWQNNRRTLIMKKQKGKVQVTKKMVHYYDFSCKEEEGAHADKKIKKTHDDNENPRKKDENDQALFSNENTLSSIGSNIFICDSAATSQMTKNKDWSL